MLTRHNANQQIPEIFTRSTGCSISLGTHTPQLTRGTVENKFTPRVFLTHGYSRLFHRCRLRAGILTAEEVQYTEIYRNISVIPFMTVWISVQISWENYTDFHVLLYVLVLFIIIIIIIIIIIPS